MSPTKKMYLNSGNIPGVSRSLWIPRFLYPTKHVSWPFVYVVGHKIGFHNPGCYQALAILECAGTIRLETSCKEVRAMSTTEEDEGQASKTTVISVSLVRK